MARKPARKPRPFRIERGKDDRGSRERDPIVAAFMALLAEKPIEQIGFAEIAAHAGVSLAELRGRSARRSRSSPRT